MVSNTVLFVCAKKDDDWTFVRTFKDFSTRVEIIGRFGVTTDVREDIDTMQKIEECERAHPSGLFSLYLRGHGSAFSFDLSNAPGGVISPLQGEQVRRICQAIRSGGILITESCENGAGQENLLKFLASQCRPGVTVIGSQGTENTIEFDGHLRHHRYSNSIDRNITRIYYQTEMGPVDVPSQELDALRVLVGKVKSPATTALCLQALAEKIQNPNYQLPAIFFRNPQNFREHLKTLCLTLYDVYPEWQEILHTFATISRVSRLFFDFRNFYIDRRLRQGAVSIDADGELARAPSLVVGTRDEDAYQFLLGIAILETYRPLLSFIDRNKDPSGDGLPAQCIHALTGLMLHPNPGMPILDVLDLHIDDVKRSFRIAMETGTLQEWVKTLIEDESACLDGTTEALNVFIKTALYWSD